MTRKKQARGPLKAPPLRRPGQSLNEQLDDLLFDKVFFWVFLPVIFVVIGLLDAGSWYLNVQRSPFALLIAAPFVAAFSAWRFYSIRPRIRALKLGLAGEVVVGQYLDELRAQGYRVFHDIVQNDSDGVTFNIDHVLIGPGGVFAIETKTRSKPAIGDPIITCENDSLRVDGGPADPGPIRQSQASARRIKDILADITGHSHIPVRGVVLFPGWFIEGRPTSRVWVLNPRSLPGWLDHEPRQLGPEQVALYASHLTQHLRHREQLTAS